uniref:CARD domain-containing protein n=1 Tax=Xiphophorus couchianus TaxID=32473 RepID=A0A3B5LYX5_9TELE
EGDQEKRTKNMLLDLIRKVSKETVEQVVEALVADKVLSASDRKSILETNRTRVNKASCLVDMVYERGAEDYLSGRFSLWISSRLFSAGRS